MHDVAIIGAGPVGLTLANLLGRGGNSVVVLEKQSKPYPFPRAIHFDAETMRAFQATGLAEQILRHTHIGRGMLFKNKDGLTLVDWSRDQTPGPMGWYESYRFYQPGLEQELREGLKRFEDVTLRTEHAVTSLSQSDTAVTLTLEDGSQLTARFVIGCDGTDSFTRRSLDIDLDDLGFHERWLVVDLRLTRPRPDLGDYSIQHCDPDAPATYVRGVGDWRRWEFRVEDQDTFSDDEIWAKLSKWITPEDAILERSAVYTFRSALAKSWRKNRVFLAGDAAHQTPPFMGQGMCAGIRDAANLAWKLRAVLNGADDALLDTYASERAPNARAFIEMAVSLGKLINQTAAGEAPKGQMKSIWPALGPGLGPRHDPADTVAGTLAPQIRLKDGTLSDDDAQNQFYLIALTPCDHPWLSTYTGAEAWLENHNFWGVIVRPDGYCYAGVQDPSELAVCANQIRHLTTC